MVKTLSVYVAKLGETFPLRLPESLQDKAMGHGCKQLVNDEHLQVVWKDRSGKIVYKGTEAEYRAEVRGIVVKKIAALEAGVWNGRGDPVGLTAEEWEAVNAIRAKKAAKAAAASKNGA
mgnify:FL=1